jgi:hypothetical protein
VTTYFRSRPIIGELYTIPYKEKVMIQAFNNLYEPDRNDLKANYRYVRFLPQSPEDMNILLHCGYELWDYPLNCNVIQYGEKYHDPTISDEKYTWYYTVIPIRNEIPKVYFEEIERLIVVTEDSRWVEEAFKLTENTYDAPDDYEDMPEIGEDGEVIYTLNPEAHLGGGGSIGHGNPTKGECGCPMPDHERKPSGCIKVEDNMLRNYEGVKQVEVITSKINVLSQIFHRKTQTDDNGCWQINHKYKGKIHVFVRFESSTCNIKAMDALLDMPGYTFPRRTHIGSFWGPNFNDLPIAFDWSNDIDSNEFRNWMAATANNSVHDMIAYCGAQGLPVGPPKNLIVLLTQWGDDQNGSAPMFDKIGGNQLPSTAVGVFAALGVVGASSGVLIGAGVGAIFAAAIPDVIINLNNPNQVNSDDMHQLMYHELAHAVHYAQVGNTYWLDNIGFVAQNAILGFNPPYGASFIPGSGRCNIIEMWGFQTGMSMADAKYGSNHSNGNAAGSWQARLERAMFQDSYIAYGWQNDIRDVNNSSLLENTLVTDDVSGFTQAQIFSTMTVNMLSGNQQRLLLQTMLPTPISTMTYTTLAGSYGL